MGQSAFLERLNSGAVLVADGATGTNLQRRGLERGQPSEAWNFEKPDEIVRLHRDFIQAGADILLTNTFGASALRLETAGLKGRVTETNQRAVDLARQAANGSDVLIAGSIGPSGGLLKPLGPLEESQVFESFAGQAQALAEAGVDLIVVETHFDINEATQAVRAVRSACDLPLVCSFSYDRGTRTMMGVNATKMAKAIAPLGVDMLGINCGRGLDENMAALTELAAVTDLPIWFKPNAGMPQLDSQGNAVYSISPQEMGALAPKWLAAGARVVGGCCGTSPEHLAEIASHVKGI